MANEIKMSAQLYIAQGGVTINGQGADVYVTMAGTAKTSNVQAVGFAAAEAIDIGDITDIGYVWLRNADATNFVTVGWTDPPTEMKLLPGEFALFPTRVETMYAKADTAAVNLEVVAVSL